MKRSFWIIGLLMLLLVGCGKPNLSNTEQSLAPTEGQDVTENESEETERQEIEDVASSWVKDLDIAQTTSQIIIVSAEGSYGTVSMHTKGDDGIWKEEFSISGRVGRKGVGKEKEGDEKTPVGVYRFTTAFGILPNPGITALPYVKLDETHHWVDDSQSKYYNQMVSTRDVEKDWNSSEHLYKSVYSYKYVLALDYNAECVPGKGSAIFLHCPSKNNEGTSGCISIPEKTMCQVMQLLQPGCVIIIDEKENISNY